VNVASVAWITERKNPLSMFFYLASLLCYLRFDIPPSQPSSTRNTQHATRPLLYALSLFTFALALLSKSAVAPLPVVLLGVAWWQRERLALRDLYGTIPFFALAAAAGFVSIL